MKSTSILWLSLLPCGTNAFQFMKGWKMPTIDPHQAEVEQRFGDKSTFEIYLGGSACRWTSSLLHTHVARCLIVLAPSACCTRTGCVDGIFLWVGTQDGTSLAANGRISCDWSRARVSQDCIVTANACVLWLIRR